jgi:hypothetical protein
MKKTVYELNYRYYKYNSGMADNGYYSKTIAYESYDEAFKVYEDMSLSIAKKLDSDKDSDLCDRYIPYGGFFEDVKLTKVVRDEMLIGENGKMNDAHIFPNTDFGDCSHCYVEDEGYSPGCEHCNEGKRKLTPEAMALATSAQEWADDQVRELWKEYNAIFGLKMGLTKWNIYSDTLLLEGGYSCRGSYTGYDYEVPLSWLYASNRTELIQASFDKKEEEKNKEKMLEQQRRLIHLKEEARKLELSLGEKK